MSHDEHSGLIRDYFNEYGYREWYRFVDNPQNRVAFHIHNHYLKQNIRSGDRILEIGAGPGRFTIEIAKIGASICVGDISKNQLQFNEEKVKAAGFEDSIIWRKQLDVTDLSDIADDEFDSSVCYGGPLSYVFDKAPQALSELLRVTKSKGYILLSVMSHLGSLQFFIGALYNHVQKDGLELVNKLVENGDVVGDLASVGHYCHMFRWSELKTLLENFDCDIIASSASHYLSNARQDIVEKLYVHPKMWEKFLDWELDLSKEEGAIDGGTHIIVVLQKH